MRVETAEKIDSWLEQSAGLSEALMRSCAWSTTDPGKNLWHCLGTCARGGGPIDWVMTAQGASFRHAVELVREASPSLSVLAQPLERAG